MPDNNTLGNAKKAKKDEFYTQLSDIERELMHYRQHFKDKVIFCNCDDPYESQFFKYFALNFNRLGLKRLIATSYAGSPIAGDQLKYRVEANGQMSFSFEDKSAETDRHPYKAVINTVYDKSGNDAVEMLDVAELFESGENELTELEGDGDFRSPECLDLLDEADIVVTNPPFSLFREYVATLMEHDKKFIIIGNQNAITYKEVFPLLKENKMWIGYRFNQRVNGKNMTFRVPDDYPLSGTEVFMGDDGHKYVSVSGTGWFTNLDIKKRHEELILVKRYNPEDYPKYDNYDAINVDKVIDIPCDYDGIMGVPITFMDKYCPEQFEIVGISKTWYGAACKTYPQQIQVNKSGDQKVVTKLNDGPVIKLDKKPENMTYYMVDDNYYLQLYARILIRNKHPEKPRGVK